MGESLRCSSETVTTLLVHQLYPNTKIISLGGKKEISKTYSMKIGRIDSKTIKLFQSLEKENFLILMEQIIETKT